MNVAVLHYHFDPGGVSRVVDSTVAAFRGRADFRFGLLSGRPVSDPAAPAAVLPGLDYTAPGAPAPDPRSLHAEAVAAARKLFDGREPDLWHIHNPALGKNSAFCGLVARLAREGRALLLHQHDFAEDFRPANHLLREQARAPGDPAFPVCGRLAYAVLNGRDHDLLLEAGLDPGQCHLLPNPVPAPGGFRPADPSSDLLLYPVRALARKNLGELLLLAQAFRGRFRFETTLEPTNPAYRPRFDRWKQTVRDLGLPVRLGAAAGDGLSFAERMDRCRTVLSTSVAEGFGLAFLEPWTFGRPVAGRDLPEITGSFRQEGIPLDHLYARLPVPADCLPGDPRTAWREGLERSFAAYRTEPDRDAIAAAAEDLFGGAEVDFALLGEEAQEAAIRHFERRGTSIDPPFDPDALPGPETVAAAERAVRERFSPAAYAERLGGIYRTIANAPATPLRPLDAEALLRGFLQPRRFRPHFRPPP